MSYIHKPVLLKEVIEVLRPKENQNFVDATLGGGGYTEELLKRNGPNGKVLAIDLDDIAIKNIKDKIKEKRLKTKHGNFREIDKYVGEWGEPDISGIVADIGISSNQLDNSDRGISFKKDELLDMRMDVTGNSRTAEYILNNSDEKTLRGWFREFGEDPNSNKIARNVVRFREEKKIKTTTDLVQIIKSSLPKPVQHKWEDTARRIFQAIRIVVNDELANLEEFLPKAVNILPKGGKLAVVTFHSLEDRIVKQFFVKMSKGCVCPPDFPACVCGKSPIVKLITKKPITAGELETKANSRSLSAKLRVIEKY